MERILRITQKLYSIIHCNLKYNYSVGRIYSFIIYSQAFDAITSHVCPIVLVAAQAQYGVGLRVSTTTPTSAEYEHPFMDAMGKKCIPRVPYGKYREIIIEFL